MGYFGNQTYNTKAREFIGKPLEQIAATNQILSERYEKVKQGKRALELSTEALRTQVRDQNKEHVDTALSGIKNKFSDTLLNDDYENAGNTLMSAQDELARNQELKYSQEDYKRMQTYQEELKKRLKAGDGKGGLDQATINYAIAKSNAVNNKKIKVDEKGNVTGMFSGINPTDDINWSDKITDLATKFRANTAVNSTSGISKSKYNDGMTQGFISYMGERKTTGVKGDELKRMASDYLSTTPEYKAWVNQQADMKAFYNLQHDESGNPIYDSEGNLSYADIADNNTSGMSDIKDASKYSPSTELYNGYKQYIDSRKDLTAAQKEGAIQDWVRDYDKADNNKRVETYKNYIAGNITGNLIDYAGDWANFGVEDKMSSVDWEGFRKGYGGESTKDEIVVSNTTGFMPQTVEDIATEFNNKKGLEQSLAQVTKDIITEQEKGDKADKGWLKQLDNERVTLQSQLSGIQSAMNKKLEYVKNDKSNSKIDNLFDVYINNKSQAFTTNPIDNEKFGEDKDFAGIIGRFQAKSVHIGQKALSLPRDKQGDYTLQAYNKLKEDFRNEIYNHALSKKDTRNPITLNSSVGKLNNIFKDIRHASSKEFEKNKQKEGLVKNTDVYHTNQTGEKDKDGVLSKTTLAYTKALENTDMYVVGTDNVSLQNYTELNTDNFVTLDASGKEVPTKVDLKQSTAGFGRKVVNGETQLVVTLKNASGDVIYDNRNKGDGKPREAQVIVKPSDQNTARVNLFNIGKSIYNKGITEKKQDLMDKGIEDMANSYWGDVSKANPESLSPGDSPRVIEIVHGGNRQKHLFKFIPLEQRMVKGSKVNRFKVEIINPATGQSEPLIPKVDKTGKPIISNGKMVEDFEQNSFESDQEVMIYLFNAEQSNQ